MKQIKSTKQVLYIISSIAIAFLVIYLYTMGVLNNLIGDKLTIRSEYYVNLTNDVSLTSYFVILVLIIPIIEETIFRWGLKFSINGTAALCLGITYTIYLFFQPSDINWKNPYALIIFWSAFILSFFLYRILLKRYQTFIIKLYKKNNKLIIIISIISFAYSHIIIYGQHDLINNLLLSPLILLPYVISGILFSFFRIKFGFWYGVLGHVLWNSLAFYLVNF